MRLFFQKAVILMFMPNFYHSVYRLVLLGLIGFALLIAPSAQAAQLKILTLNVLSLIHI